MGNKESAATDKNGASKRGEQASALLKDTTADGQANIEMVQNVLLIWLDKNIDDNDEDCKHTISQLRCVVNTIYKFTDSEECIKFIKTINKEKVCMIISGTLGEHFVPRIHNMSQVDSIFIFCGKKERHKLWAENWAKIKGVFTEIPPVCEALKQTAHQCEQNSTSISFMATNDDMFNKGLNQLHCSFMYTQMLKDILLTIKFEQNHIMEFVEHCQNAFVNNEEQLINVKELEDNYHHKTPVWWYSCESFLYPMLNRALRVVDVDLIIKMGFFIADLHRHIEHLYNEQFNIHNTDETFIVYRGQGLNKKNLAEMTKAKGGLLSFNNFLSTSRNRDIPLNFARNALCDGVKVGIFFVMTIDPSKSTIPFASIKSLSKFSEEDEVLFSMHTVFRIHDIKSMDKNDHLFQVDLTLTNENDEHLRILTERIQKGIDTETKGWYRLGKLLLKIGHFDKALKLYEVLLGQTTNDTEKAFIYHHIGWAIMGKREYKVAITYYEKAIEIREQSLLSNNRDLARSYNDIGNAYCNIGNYSIALSYYEKAFKIWQQVFRPNHPHFAMSYNNIGNVYCSMRKYSEALSYYENAVEIRHRSLPLNHPDLAMSYNNIGLVHENMRDYTKARSYYECAVDIGQRSLPLDHPDLQTYRNNLENIKKKT